jgi:hypothetical protein
MYLAVDCTSLRLYEAQYPPRLGLYEAQYPPRMQMANLFDHANRFDSQAMLDPAVAAWGGASFQIVCRSRLLCTSESVPDARALFSPRRWRRSADLRTPAHPRPLSRDPVCVLTEPYPLTVKAVLYRELLRSSRSADGTSKRSKRRLRDLPSGTNLYRNLPAVPKPTNGGKGRYTLKMEKSTKTWAWRGVWMCTNLVEESNESVCKHGSGSRSTRRGAKHANGLLKGWGWTSGEENFVN